MPTTTHCILHVLPASPIVNFWIGTFMNAYLTIKDCPKAVPNLEDAIAPVFQLASFLMPSISLHAANLLSGALPMAIRLPPTKLPETPL